jgi:hypothetical protein
MQLELPKDFTFSVDPRHGRIIQQHPDEWLWLWQKLGPIQSILEIGSFDGTSFLALAAAGVIRPGGKIRAIDTHDHGVRGHKLSDTFVGLEALGFDAKVFFGDSKSIRAIAWAQQWRPYDVVFVDGDHSHKAVMNDASAYGPLGRTIVFHDISGSQTGCVRFWKEIDGHKEEFTAKTAPFGDKQGCGILWQPKEEEHAAKTWNQSCYNQ